MFGMLEQFFISLKKQDAGVCQLKASNFLGRGGLKAPFSHSYSFHLFYWVIILQNQGCIVS